jgi:hypothetical protein
MHAALGLSRLIDAITTVIGKSVIWLIFAAILISAINAVTRKLWSLSSNSWLEAQWYLFGAAFMLGAAYTLKENEHIRIDILSAKLSQRGRNIVEFIGHFLFDKHLDFAAIDQRSQLFGEPDGTPRIAMMPGSRPDELKRHENAGLEFAMEHIHEIQEDGNHITALLSYSDLIQLGGYAAV